MIKSDINLAKILTYSGTLPLVACIALIFAPIAGLDANVLAKTYGAIILSFLCGIHWALFLFFSEKCPHPLLITSNVLALLAWCSLLGIHHKMAFALQALCFVIVFALDVRLHRVGILPEWFYHLRRNATAIVVICLSAMALLS
jgi:Protein of unknown function (DUF3429)